MPFKKLESVKSIDFSDKVQEFLFQYSIDNEPIEVSFRQLVPYLDKQDRATHLIHSYPAKLLMHIPHFFLNNTVFSTKGDYVLDPFCGSGTVLLEAILAGRNALGADANPLARLITEVKTTLYNTERLKIHLNNLKLNIVDCEMLTDFDNINYWFYPETKLALSRLFVAIQNIENTAEKNFFLVCFSNCVKKVSLADPRVSVPVKLNADRYHLSHPYHDKIKRKINDLRHISVTEKFFEIVDLNILKFEKLNLEVNKSELKPTSVIVSNDARNLGQISEKGDLLNESVQLVLSSPPYAGAQKYIRASSLNLGWLKFIDKETTLKYLDGLNIGRENYTKKEYKTLPLTNISEADALLQLIWEKNPLRAYIAANYLEEMREAIKEIRRVLKFKGYFVLIAANNQVCGYEFKTQEYLLKIAEELGFKVVLKMIDDIKSYGLMTKRNKTASIITREWVLVFQK